MGSAERIPGGQEQAVLRRTCLVKEQESRKRLITVCDGGFSQHRKSLLTREQ